MKVIQRSRPGSDSSASVSVSKLIYSNSVTKESSFCLHNDAKMQKAWRSLQPLTYVQLPLFNLSWFERRQNEVASSVLVSVVSQWLAALGTVPFYGGSWPAPLAVLLLAAWAEGTRAQSWGQKFRSDNYPCRPCTGPPAGAGQQCLSIMQINIFVQGMNSNICAAVNRACLLPDEVIKFFCWFRIRTIFTWERRKIKDATLNQSWFNV